MSQQQPKVLAIYSHKGGVGKTTLVHTIAESVSHGLDFKRVLLIDLDTQMNLTCKLLGSEQEFERYINSIVDIRGGADYRDNRDIKSKLSRITNYSLQGDVNPNPLEIWKQSITRNSPCIDLIPGFPEMKLLSSHISREIESSDDGLNWCYSLRNLIREYHNKFHYDLVMLDLGPDLYAINSCALWSSDFVLIPCTADLYSAMSFRLVRQEIFPDNSPTHMYNRFQSRLRVIGFVPNRVKTHGQQPTTAQQDGIAMLRDSFDRHLGGYYQPCPALFGHQTIYDFIYIKLVGAHITGNETSSLWELNYTDNVERNLMHDSLHNLVRWLNNAIC
eukprot:gene10656-11816_t